MTMRSYNYPAEELTKMVLDFPHFFFTISCLSSFIVFWYVLIWVFFFFVGENFKSDHVKQGSLSGLPTICLWTQGTSMRTVNRGEKIQRLLRNQQGIYTLKERLAMVVMYGLESTKRFWNDMTDTSAEDTVTAETMGGLLKLKDVH